MKNKDINEDENRKLQKVLQQRQGRKIKEMISFQKIKATLDLVSSI